MNFCVMESEHECELKLPNDREIIETPIAHFWWGNRGVLYSIAKPEKRNLEMVRESMKILIEKIGNKKVCLISDTSKTTYYTVEMREELSHLLAKRIKAVALVPCTPAGKTIGSILFMRNNGLPARIFDKLKDAEDWIKGYC